MYRKTKNSKSKKRRIQLCILAYLIGDVAELRAILGLQQLLDLLAALDDRLVEFFLYQRSIALRCWPVDLLRLVAGRTSLQEEKKRFF